MKVEILQVGKNKDSWVREAVGEFEKRLPRFCDLEIITIQDEKVGSGRDEQVKAREGERVIKRLKQGYVTIALDVLGSQYTSEDFSKLIVKIKDQEGGKVQFIIGGALGLSGEVLARAKYRLSLSRLTFSHQIARIALLEQIFRAFEIARGSEYHK